MSAELKARRDALLVEVRDVAAKAHEAGRAFTPDEESDLNAKMDAAAQLDTEIEAATKSDAITSRLTDFLAKGAADEQVERLLSGSDSRGHQRLKSLGELFTDSAQYAGFMKSFAGAAPESMKGFRTEPMSIPGGLKALIGSTGTNGTNNLVTPDRPYPVAELSWPRVALRDVITVGSTTSDLVEYVQVIRPGISSTPTFSAAAGVPEAKSTLPIAAVADSTHTTAVLGGLKPESKLGFEKKNAPVITIAHWIPATKRALSDPGQLRTLIDSFLRKGLAQETERQVLNGNPSNGEEFTGILNTTGVQDQAFDLNLIRSIRKGITKVSRFGVPNGILLSPANNERLDLATDVDGRYFGGGPFGNVNPSIWRLPRIEVPSLTDNEVVVGDLSTCVLWDREQATITATDSHQDFFTRNLVAILAESRAAFGVLDPALLCSVNTEGEDLAVPAE